MKAAELRIGNYISIAGNIIITSYHEIRLAQINKDNNYTPIPLTEQWLKDFGFEQPGRSRQWILKESLMDLSDRVINSFYINKIHGKYQVRKRSRDTVFLRYVEYIHQLQNLYFALTGKEL